MSNPLAARFASNTPIIMGADQSDWLSKALPQVAGNMVKLEQRMAAESVAYMSDGFWPKSSSWLSEYRPYVVKGGTLMIPVKGMLLHEFSWALGSWATGYQYLQKAFERGMADPEVERIAMIVNTPGGEVAGCFDAVDKVFAMKGTKPIRAFVADAAYSAGFAWASVADKVSMTRTAGVGSVGVVTAHVDMSGAMEEAGLKVTFIHAGERKVDGNPYEALSAPAKASIQKRINSMYNIFVSTTARNLNIDEAAVRETEAQCYSATEALAIGFAHEVRSFDEALAAFAGESGNPAGETEMPKEKEQEQASVTQADLNKARAEGVAQGVAAEQARISGILASEEAKNRPTMSMHLALKTQQSVDEAVALLAVSPEEKASASQGSEKATGQLFEAAMSQDNPDLGAAGEQKEQSSAEATLQEFRAVTGFGSK